MKQNPSNISAITTYPKCVFMASNHPLGITKQLIQNKIHKIMFDFQASKLKT